MRVLVTGGAGYIGSVIVEKLVERGDQVVVLDDFSQGHRQAICADATLVEGDIGDANLLGSLLHKAGIEAVIHMAAETVVEKSMAEPRRFFVENVQKGIVLLNAMLDAGVKRIVFSSSAAVYGEPEAIPIEETSTTRPVNSYGETKLMFERVLHWYEQAYGLKHVSLRYFNAAGASEANGPDQFPKTHIIPIVLDVAYGQRDHIDVFGTDYDTPDGTCIRDYIHVLDLADAHIRALERLHTLSSVVYNLGTGVGYSVREVIETTRRISGRRITAFEAERRAGDPEVLVASRDRAEEDLDWKPTRDLEDIVASGWAWKQLHPNGYGR